MTVTLKKEEAISAEMNGMRLDQALAILWPDYSRSRLTQWIREQAITLNGQSTTPKAKLKGGEYVRLNATLSACEEWQAEAIPLNIVYEDDDLLVINKPAGLVMHPATGHTTGTLVNALLYHDANLAHLPRAGIVHRLDQDTTGLCVVARNLNSHHSLVDQLQQRLIKRHYQALVNGCLIAGGCVNAPIGRHPKKRLCMSVRYDGKAAVTHYRVAQRFTAHTLLDIALETGRTHQIRVHMAHLNHALVGDKLYGARPHLPKEASQEVIHALQHFSRQALHAYALGLTHPSTQEWIQWESKLPSDIQALLKLLG